MYNLIKIILKITKGFFEILHYNQQQQRKKTNNTQDTY